MRAVLDTNVIIDLLHFADPEALLLRAAIDDGSLLCFSDRQCLSELERVAAYPQFALDGLAQRALLEDYRGFVRLCEPAGVEDGEAYRLPRCRDADDQKFLILALRCRADLLITRDRELLRLAGRRRPAPSCAIVGAAAAAAWLSTSSDQPSASGASTDAGELAAGPRGLRR
ncbi:MAG: putative toxin-antitoxin system toxin component, PIN family [Candidatus Accumulibacter appositus]|uniref:Putative toxin-antitoxin system toxin component, PIN family n=1 Tax=Candidatus Accumulibacter appositus TaxID=1454003 RepID=A0A011QMF7_9PROT|nr:putative toxin-antitoxin system toxin component, PIN family [Accumulibacter sp.]EXI80034.1 MAG: putative toxin-antitoxin system toxin component, PIN family [Candidatus Accumulibacter appositus]HRF07000.1 putative toxin-antitoxin system toxin component, PIN family [Accumulibacter sp.]